MKHSHIFLTYIFLFIIGIINPLFTPTYLTIIGASELSGSPNTFWSKRDSVVPGYEEGGDSVSELGGKPRTYLSHDDEGRAGDLSPLLTLILRDINIPTV